MERTFSWFPVVVERPWHLSQRRLLMYGAARYTDGQSDVVIVNDQYQGNTFPVGTVISDTPNEFRYTDDQGRLVVMRPVRPDDAVKGWGIPLPVEIIGALMSNTISPPTVAAAVDDDGTVHTMILETDTGLYARYSRTWILMTDISPIEQLDIVNVPETDLEHYDMADDVGATVNIRDLSPDVFAPAQYALGASSSAPPPSAVTASIPGMVLISSAADLPEAIAFAATEHGAPSRWYVGRRAKAFGYTDPLPWEE